MIMHRQWMDGHGHPWLWLLASTALVLLWGGALWAAIGLLRGRGSARSGSGADSGGARTADARDDGPLASAERILAERLARGEIDVDEYRSRSAAIRPSESPTR
ncbi:MAG: hypothetical protein RJB61_778 [Actinomycetota bacterium]